jgi:ribonuclease-3
VNNLDFQNKIGYEFKDKTLLKKALTHSSYIKEKKERCDRNNERLEFLGDAFFDAIISEELYRRLDMVEEGKLTKLRALIVCEKSLACHGQQIEIGKYLYLGKGEECTGGRSRDSLLADAVEAVIGAVFLDGGYEAARDVVLKIFKARIDDAASDKLNDDYKTELQEKLQAKGETRISYVIEDEKGPDHDKTFYIALYCADELAGRGQGKSKKEAEQNAAKEALERGVGICTLKE